MTLFSQISIVAAVNDEKILNQNLLRSRLISEDRIEYKICRGFRSAGAAYNHGVDHTTGELVVFVHQDVYLPTGWFSALERAVEKIEARSPNWAVIGAFGLSTDGHPVGHVWSSGIGRLLGGYLPEPIEAICLDEVVMVLRRASGLRFDSELPGFHLYGTDIVLSARAEGKHCYIADIPVIHNSRPVFQLKKDYALAHRYMRRKWLQNLPVPTLIAPLTKSPLPLLKRQFIMRFQKRHRLIQSFSPSTDPREIARQIGFE